MEPTDPTIPGWHRWAILVLALAVAGCASLQERTTATENRIAALEAQVADLQASQQNIIQRLSQVRDDLESALAPLRSRQADRGESLRSAQSEISALREQVLQMGERIDQLVDQVATLQAGAGGSTSPDTGPGPDTGAGVPTPGETIYDAAFADYLNGNYVLAVDGFTEFLGRYPNSTKAPSALYFMGESLSAQGDHGEARNRFLEVVRRYPDAGNVPDAKLRAALESVELGRSQEAVAELRRLIAEHPDTDAVLVGCMQLDRLGEPLPDGCRPPLP